MNDAAAPSLRRHRPFRLFWWARVATTIAFQMQAVAIGWQVYALTRSALDLGLIGLAQFVPGFALSLIVGQIADRYDRRRILRLCQGVEALVALALALASAFAWLTTGWLFAGLRHRCGARDGAAGPPCADAAARPGGAHPARGRRLGVIQPDGGHSGSGAGRRRLRRPTRAGLRSLQRGVSRRRRSGGAHQRRRPATRAREARPRIAFCRHRVHSRAAGGHGCDLARSVRRAAGRRHRSPADLRARHSHDWGLGLLRSAPAVGALSAALVLSRRPLGGGVGRIMFIAVIGFGVATIVFAFSTSFPLSLAALAVLGAADSVSVVIRFSLVQIATPDAMRGRVSAVNSGFIGASNSLGEFESGVTAAWFGTVPAVLIGGVGTIVVALLWIRLFPELFRIDRLTAR